jgi:hypothetical protein
LGTPILQQSAPLSLDPSQFASTEQMETYYNVYPEQFFYDNAGGGGGGGGGGIQPIQEARLVKRAHAVKPQGWGGRRQYRPGRFTQLQAGEVWLEASVSGVLL